MGIYGDELIIPVFLPAYLKGQLFFEFLNNNLYQLLENVRLINRINGWMQ